MDIQIPVASVFQCFSTQIQFWVSCYSLHKKICIFPSLTQAVSITDTKNWRQKTRHFQCSKSNLEASFINLMGYKNIGKNLVISKKCFHSEKWCWNHPLFDHFFGQICLKNTKYFFKNNNKLGAISKKYFLIKNQILQDVKKKLDNNWNYFYKVIIVFWLFKFSVFLELCPV